MTYEKFTSDIIEIDDEDDFVLRRFFDRERRIPLGGISLPSQFIRNFMSHTLRKGIDVSLFTYTDSEASKTYAHNIFGIAGEIVLKSYDNPESGKFRQNGWTHHIDPSATNDEIFDVFKELFTFSSLNFCLVSRSLPSSKKTDILAMASERGQILYLEI